MLLQSLLQTFRQQPGASACLPLGQWFGTPAGTRLQAIGALELPIATVEQEFFDTLEALRTMAVHQQLEQSKQRLSEIDYKNIDKTQAKALLAPLYRLKLDKH